MAQSLSFPFRRQARLATGKLRFGLWVQGPPLPDVRLDSEGITAASLTFEEGKGELHADPRTLRWSEVEALQLERDIHGEISLVFSGPDDPRFIGPLRIDRSDLIDPDAFQHAVESLAGRRFENTFEEARPEDSQPIPRSPFSAPGEALAEDLAAGSADSRSFRVTTVWGAAWATILSLAISGALFGLILYVAPPSISRIINSSGFFALLVGGGGMALAVYLIPRLAHYRLIAARAGLYARVPGRRFPRFTPWRDVKDFTLTDGRVRSFQLASGGRNRANPPRRVTLWTPAGSYSFECSEIENEYELARIILKHRAARG
jgi:hypothetical protein